MLIKVLTINYLLIIILNQMEIINDTFYCPVIIDRDRANDVKIDI